VAAAASSLLGRYWRRACGGGEGVKLAAALAAGICWLPASCSITCGVALKMQQLSAGLEYMPVLMALQLGGIVWP